MDEMTFKENMAYLSAAYSQELTPEKAAVYWDQLGQMLDEPFTEAVLMAVGHCQWFPSVAELRRFYSDRMYHRRMNSQTVIEHKAVDKAKAKAILAELKRELGKRPA
ncbi:hypothetical protein [Thiolapillus sp.]